MFDPTHTTTGAEHGVSDLVKHVRVLQFGFEHKPLSLGPLGLYVVLPEEALLLAHAAHLAASLAVRIIITIVCGGKIDNQFMELIEVKE